MKAATKRFILIVAVAAIVAMFASSPLAAAEIGISISPNVINIASESTVVTVHTDIPYSAVVGADVTLNGIEIKSWKSDNRGFFVAKFLAGDVKGVVEAGTAASLVLTGATTDGETFSGIDEVDVIDIGKK